VTERTKDWGVVEEKSYGGYGSPTRYEQTYTEAEARAILDVSGDGHALARREVVPGCPKCIAARQHAEGGASGGASSPCDVHPENSEHEDDEKWVVVEIRYGGKRFVDAPACSAS
jgi:hypothetical protein